MLVPERSSVDMLFLHLKSGERGFSERVERVQCMLLSLEVSMGWYLTSHEKSMGEIMTSWLFRLWRKEDGLHYLP